MYKTLSSLPWVTACQVGVVISKAETLIPELFNTRWTHAVILFEGFGAITLLSLLPSLPPRVSSVRLSRPLTLHALYYLRWLVPVFHARAHVRLPTREEPPARKAKQIWRRSALFAKGYLAHFENKFVFTRDCITKKVLSYFEIWKKSASGTQCSCFRYKWALVLWSIMSRSGSAQI